MVRMTPDAPHLDPRARRTLDSLQVALGKHMQTQQLSEISVSEICRTAGVHRTTFYKHFESVAELAGMAMTDLVRRISEESGGQVHTYAQWLTSLVEHVGRRRETYRSILGPKGDPGLQRALAEQLVAKAEDAVSAAHLAREDLGMSPAAAGKILGHGSFGAVVALVTSDSVHPEEAAASFLSALPGAWQQVLGADLGDARPATSPADETAGV